MAPYVLFAIVMVPVLLFMVGATHRGSHFHAWTYSNDGHIPGSIMQLQFRECPCGRRDGRIQTAGFGSTKWREVKNDTVR